MGRPSRSADDGPRRCQTAPQSNSPPQTADRADLFGCAWLVESVQAALLASRCRGRSRPQAPPARPRRHCATSSPISKSVYVNGLNELISLEEHFLYPVMKSSELARRTMPSRVMLVTQRTIGEDTSSIADHAPLTWRYLESRSSSIYRNRLRFSIFGIGEYSFTPWKAAISGFYKKLEFVSVGPKDGKPVVLDDTCYFLPCGSEEEAGQLTQLLNAESARGFFDAFVFWDAKRPITVGLLANLDLDALASECGSSWTSEQPALPLLSQGRNWG